MKKVFLILVLAMNVMTMMAEEFKIGKLTFEITSPTEVRLRNAADDITTVYLGETIDYQGKMYTVTSIGERAFWDCSSLTSVTIPNSVTSIEWEAFSDCSSLTSIAIPNSVTSIGSRAFYGTALYENPSNWENGALYISNCLISVDEGFAGHFRIKENTQVIAYGAFDYCSSLTSVTIPNSVTSIDGAFRCCSSLTSVTIPNSVTSIGWEAFQSCSSLISVTIPNSVTSIGSWAFSDCSSLTSVTIPSSVTIIANEAFEDCSALTSITIPNSVTSIGRSAFSGCSSLTSVRIPKSVKEIGESAFEGTAFYNDPANWENGTLYINDCLIKVDEGFAGHFRIKENTRLISGGAFEGCSALTSVTIPNSVTSMGYGAFFGTALYKNPSKWENGALYIDDCLIEVDKGFAGHFRIKENTRVLAVGAFLDCKSLTSVTIPNSVTSIGYGAFGECESLTSVTIPNSVTSIGDMAFEGCYSLTSVTIPNGVTSIGNYAFPEHTQIIRQ